MGIKDLVLQLVLASAVLAEVCTAQSCPNFKNGCSCSTYTSGVTLLDLRCEEIEFEIFPEIPADIHGHIGRL